MSAPRTRRSATSCGRFSVLLWGASIGRAVRERGRMGGEGMTAIDATKGIRSSKDAKKRDPAEPCRSEEAGALRDTVGWHIARVRPGEEFRVVDRLDIRGVFAFTPTNEVFRRWTRFDAEKSWRIFAQAPGYVVVGMPRVNPRWSDVFECEGVNSVFSLDLRPGVVIPIDIGHANVRRIMDMCRGARQAERFMKARQEFDAGDQARMVAGPYEGAVFEVVRFEDDMRIAEARAIIVTEILGAMREVSVPVSDMVLHKKKGPAG